MSAVDQAFIRAYALDESPRSPFAGRAPLTSRSGSMQVETSSERFTGPRNGFAAYPAGGASASGGTLLVEAPSEAIGSRRAVADATETLALRASSPSDDDLAPSIEGVRRPLSAWSPRTSVASSFQPALEVDCYNYSDVCRALLADPCDWWQGAVDALLAAIDKGESILGVVGVEPHMGCTTTVICLGRLLARQGLRVAWVDGDFQSSQLAGELGLAVEAGWEQVLAGRIPLAECAVHSLDEQIVLLPLLHGGLTAAKSIDSVQASVSAGMLRYHFDIVLVDLGAMVVASQVDVAERLARQCRIDGILLVRDERAAGPDCLSRLQEKSPELAKLYLGEVVNFSEPPRRS